MKPQENEQLKKQFLGWQCRLRQIAMREDGGRPTSGMCPKVFGNEGDLLAEQIVILLNRIDQYDDTTYFKFQVQRENDPKVVREKGLTLLLSTYYQKAREFTDVLTSVFLNGSPFAANLLERGSCILEFNQFNQSFRLACKVEATSQFEPCREAAIWHNRIFNTQLPGDVIVLKFTPDWENSQTN